MFVARNKFLIAIINSGVNKFCHSNLKQQKIYSESNFANLLQVPKHNFEFARYKSKKSRKQEATETETEEDDDILKDVVVDKHSKLMNVHVNSTRVDLLLKAGLGIARNKIETLFYEDKIRLNGQKVLKKSEPAAEGDEIDVIKGVSVNNPELLTVARVEVLSIKPKEEGFKVAVRRCKSLLVENYEKSGQK